MRKSFLWLFILGAPNISIGQRYKTVDILKKADSLIISVVGQEIFNEHYQLDTIKETDPVQISIYQDQGIEPITLKTKINKHFKFLSVGYTFYVKKFEDPSVRLDIIFDKYLNSQYPIDTSFIPKFILQKTKGTLLTRDQALEIAISTFKKKGLRIETKIFYNPKENMYIWEVTNIIWEHQGGSSVEHLTLNAENGKIIDFYEALQGQLH